MSHRGGASEELHNKHFLEYTGYKKPTCEICGTGGGAVRDAEGFLMRKGEKLTVHHVDGNVANNDPSNLQTLCRKSHNGVHGIR